MLQNAPWAIIKELEENNSRLFKEETILREATNGNDMFFNGIRLSLDPLITFGIKKVATQSDTHIGHGLDWKDFLIVINKLQSRELSGNAAIKAVDDLKNQATIEQWNYWYRRILIKDLRCGVSAKTVNNGLNNKYPQYEIKTFQAQLAHDSTKYENKMVGVKQCEIKLDGVRVLTVVYPDGNVMQYSRNGRELKNFTKVVDTFKQIAANLAEPMVFDGEIVSATFNKLMTQVFRKSNVKADDAVLYLFDMLPLRDFIEGISNTPQRKRTEQLEQFYESEIAPIKDNNIKVIEHITVDLDTPDGYKKFLQFNAECIESGLEGIIAKDVNAPYECKRTFSWLKLKPYIEVTLHVDAIEEGTGKNKGRLGALVCSGTDESLPDNVTLHCNVGSGFSDKLRKQIFENQKRVIGQYVEVRADAISHNAEDGYSLRFPRFRSFRGFKLGEKL